MFRGASFRLIHNPEVAAINAHLDRLVRAGRNAVSIIPHQFASLTPGTADLCAPPPEMLLPWFIYPDVGQDSSHPFHNTPDPALVYLRVKLAASKGLQVMLKPHVDSNQASWRGNISVLAKQFDWAFAYQNFLAPYVSIAMELPGTILCLGCEFYTVAKELGAPFWVSLARWVRNQGYRGPMTYAANWGIELDAEYNRLADLWPLLDYVGVDRYFPLVPPEGPDDPDLMTLLAGWHRRIIDASWCPRIDVDLLAAATKAGMPLLFTEIGYANRLGTTKEPSRETQPGDVVSDEAQATAALAARQHWESEPQFAGYFWWETWLGPDQPISHNILGRPAEAVVLGA